MKEVREWRGALLNNGTPETLKGTLLLILLTPLQAVSV